MIIGKRLGIILAVAVAACSGGSEEVAAPPAPEPPPPAPPPPEPSVNGVPSFDSGPLAVADHNRLWEFQIVVSDPDNDPVTVTIVNKPTWMTFDDQNLVLSGTAGEENIGSHSFTLSATDGQDSTDKSFSILVVEGEIICNQDFGDPAASLYMLPFQPGTARLLSQSYCPSNPAFGHFNWFAYDFDMPIGDTVVASRDGVVTAIRENNPDGTRMCNVGHENFVFVGHADGTRMSYVHLTINGALVDVGDVVTQGQPIGLSGDSGCSIGPHTHLALFRDNTDFGQKNTLPLNYSNATGPLDANRGLVSGQMYTAF